MSAISLNLNPQQVAQIALRQMGPLGNAVATAVNVFQTAQNAQSALNQLQSALGKLSELAGSGGGQGSGLLAGGPGCVSPGSIPAGTMSNPLQALMGGGELQKHAKAPIAGDGNWPAFSDAANNRCSGHRPLFDGSNIWNKQGAARDEAALVGWATQQNDTVQYDTDRKMFYQTDVGGGNRRDVMSLDELKKVADGAGGISQNNLAGFQAVGKAMADASKAAEAPPLQKMLEALTQVFQKLLGGGGVANGANAGAAAGESFSSGAGGSASGGGAAQTNFSSGGEGGWGKIDSMMDQAEKLMNSDKPSDQLKAQQLMQKAQRMYEMISKMMEQRSQMMSKAVQAIK